MYALHAGQPAGHGRGYAEISLHDFNQTGMGAVQPPVINFRVCKACTGKPPPIWIVGGGLSAPKAGLVVALMFSVVPSISVIGLSV